MASKGVNAAAFCDKNRFVRACHCQLKFFVPLLDLPRYQRVWSALQAPYKAQLEPMLVQYVLPCFEAPAGYLRAKACWVTQQYADIKFAAGRGRGPTFLQLFQKTLSLLADPGLPV